VELVTAEEGLLSFLPNQSKIAPSAKVYPMTTSKILRDLLCSSLYRNMDSQGWFPIFFSRIPIFHLSLNQRTTAGLPDPAIQVRKNALQDSLRSEPTAKMTGCSRES
jgi:hypothetical protein